MVQSKFILKTNRFIEAFFYSFSNVLYQNLGHCLLKFLQDVLRSRSRDFLGGAEADIFCLEPEPGKNGSAPQQDGKGQIDKHDTETDPSTK